jgi:hypothetical protein
MPRVAVSLPTGLFGTASFPFTITVGGLEIAQRLLDLHSVVLEEAASEDANGSFVCRFWDADSSLVVQDEMVVRVYDDTIDAPVFLGTIRRRNYEAATVGRWILIEAVGVGSLLDRWLVPGPESRPIEGTQARFGYFWGQYAKSPMAGSLAHVANVKTSLPADTFQNLTLRQTLRQIAAQSGSSVHFYVDAAGLPHLFSGTESSPGAAPFNINVAHPPGSGNIAPDGLSVERDGNIVNRVYVRGANAAGSGWFTDAGSVATYGPRENYIDAPSSETPAKAQSIALLQLGRTAEPNVRGRFETAEPYHGWRAGQNITITSDQHELAAFETRIVRVRTRFLTGEAKRAYEVEFSTTGANLSGLPIPGSVAIVGDVVQGTLGQDSSVALGNDQTTITSSGVIVNDGMVDRVVMGAIGGGDYGLWVRDASGNAIIDGSKVQLARSEGTIPAGVALGIAQTTVTADGVEVSHGGVDRVTLGALGGGDYGLKVVNSGATVIVDGSSDMFRIVTTSTFNSPVASGSGTFTSTVTLSTGLTDVPAVVCWMEAVRGLMIPYIIWNHADGLVTEHWEVWIENVNTNQTKLTCQLRTRFADSAYTIRYFVLEQTAF